MRMEKFFTQINGFHLSFIGRRLGDDIFLGTALRHKVSIYRNHVEISSEKKLLIRARDEYLCSLLSTKMIYMSRK